MANSPDTNEVDKPTKNVDEPAGMKPVLVRKISDDILTLGKTNIEKQQTILTAKAIEDLGTPIRWPSNAEDKARYRSDAYENKVDLNKVVDSGLRYFDRDQYINGPTFSNYKIATASEGGNTLVNERPAVIMQTIMDFNNGPQEWVIKEGSTSTTKTESEMPSNKSLREPMPTAPRGAYFRSGSNSSSDNDSGNDIKLSGSINIRQIIYPVGTSQRFDGMVFIREGVAIYRQNKSLAEGCSLHSTNFGPWQPVGNEILDATFDENDDAVQALKINTRYHIRRNWMQLSLPDPSLYKPGSKVIVIQYPDGSGFNTSSTVTGKVYIDQNLVDGSITITPAVSSDIIELPDGAAPAKTYPQRYVFSVVRENIGTTAEANGWRLEYEGLDSCSNVSGMMQLFDMHTAQPTGNLLTDALFPQTSDSNEHVDYHRVPFDGVLELVLKLKGMSDNSSSVFFVSMYDDTGTRGGFRDAHITPDTFNANKLYFRRVVENSKVAYVPAGIPGVFTPERDVVYYTPTVPESVRWVKLDTSNTLHYNINVVRRLRVYTGDIIRFATVNFSRAQLSAYDGTASARIYPCKHGELPFKTGISHVSGDADFGNKSDVTGQPAVFDTNSWGEYKKSLGVIEAGNTISDKSAEIPASLQDLHNVADYLFRIIGDYGNLQRPMSLKATEDKEYNNTKLNYAIPGIYRLTDPSDGTNTENKNYWWKNKSLLSDVFDDGSETRNAVLIVLGPGAITKLNEDDQTHYFNPVQRAIHNSTDVNQRVSDRVAIDGITGLFTSVGDTYTLKKLVSFEAQREGTTYRGSPYDYYSMQILFFKRTSGRYALYVRYGSNTGSWTTFEDVLSFNTTRDYIGIMNVGYKFEPNVEHKELISLMNKHPVVHCYIGDGWAVDGNGKRVMHLPDIDPISNENGIPMGAEVTFLFRPCTFDSDFDIMMTDYRDDGSRPDVCMGTIPKIENLSNTDIAYRQLVLRWIGGWKVVSFTDLKRTF